MSKKSVVNLANATTVMGFVLTLYGATFINTTVGILIVAMGRMLDIADGYIARRYNLASTFGATLDATMDKLGGFAILIAEWHFGIAPLWALIVIFLQNVVNALASFLYAKKVHTMLLPSRDGKYAMFCQNLAVGSFALAFVITNAFLSELFWWAGVIFTVVGVGYFGFRAAKYYYDKAL